MAEVIIDRREIPEDLLEFFEPIEVGQKTSVFNIPTKSFHGAHFAVMPAALVVPCVLAGSAPGDVVMDPFAGSGTVLSVAVKNRRRAIGAELNPEYADIARTRVGGAVPALI